MFRFFLIAFLFVTAPVSAAETAYSTVIEDLPLMQGMTEKADEAVVFDKPAGRIVEINAETAAAPQAVEQFYAEALPPLGWQTVAPATYARGDEKLKIDTEKRGAATVAHFTLTPIKGE